MFRPSFRIEEADNGRGVHPSARIRTTTAGSLTTFLLVAAERRMRAGGVTDVALVGSIGGFVS